MPPQPADRKLDAGGCDSVGLSAVKHRRCRRSPGLQETEFVQIITLSLKPDFRCSISPQIEEDHPQFDKNPLFGYTKYDQLFLSLSVNLMNLQLSQCLVDLLGAKKAMIHTLNKNHGAHWQFHQQGIYTTSSFSAQ